jgi:hypothetical protein
MTIKINARSCIAGIAAALALFAAGCDNSILESGQDRGQKALALITLSGAAAPSASARTIMPGAVSFYYTLEFRAGESVITAAISDGSVTKQVELIPGTWNVTARGYENEAGASDPANAVVTGSATITAIAGALVEVTVTLNAVVNDTGEGEVFYDIRFPESVETAALTLSPTGAGSVQKKNLIGSGAATGYLSAPSGYYRLTVELSYYDSGESKIRQAKKSAVIHLYDGLTTDISETFAAADFAEIPSFDTVEALSSYLAAQPQNTAETPYQAALRVALTDLAEGTDSLGKLFNAFNGRYVAVDLRGCTGDTIAAIADTVQNSRVYKNMLTGLVLSPSLKTIGSYTFRDSKSLQTLEWPVAAEDASIGGYAFNDSGLRAVTFPDSLKTIGLYAFAENQLQSVDLSATALTAIPTFLFQNNTMLVSAKLPNTIESISQSAFSGCSSLRELNIPNTLKTIDSSAFSGCSSLSGALTVPPSLQTIGASAFANCSFTSLDLSGTQITTIAQGAFQGNDLKIVKLPESIDNIAVSSIFLNNPSLVLVQVPASAPFSQIGSQIFNGCSPNLVFEVTGAATEEGFRTIWDGKLLIKGKAIVAASPGVSGVITIPDGIEEIKQYAFHYGYITSLTLPVGLTTIGNYAFSRCSALAFVDIPTSVTNIGSNAFANTILDTIIVRATTPPTLVAANAIPSANANLKIYVPDDSVTAYTNTSTGGFWATTTNIKNKIVALSTLLAAGD